MPGYHTVRAGQQSVLWNRRGEGKIIVGPKLVWVGVGCSLESTPLHTANEHQYLEISFSDGHREHWAGPASIYYDPVAHRSVQVKQAIDLDANEVLVVYRKKKEDGAVNRHLVYGPALHVPLSDEWHHEFVWHGSSPGDKAHKVPGGTRFTKLRIIPDQFYYNVREVRTNDEAVITVKLMLFFELKDVIKMLETTHDPVADFINAASADVISWASQRSYEDFLQQAKALNELDCFPQLTSRSKGIGYNITKVVFRGYQAPPSLQDMNDQSILSRTKLRLQMETQEQAQEQLDLQLKRDIERSKKRQEMEMQEKRHQLDMTQQAHNETLRQRQADEIAALENKAKQHSMTLQQREADDEQETRRKQRELEQALQHKINLDRQNESHLQRLKEMSVDLTPYLIAQYQNPQHLIRIDNGSGSGDGSGDRAQVHVHAPQLN